MHILILSRLCFLFLLYQIVNELPAIPDQNILSRKHFGLIRPIMPTTYYGGAEEDRTPDPLRARQVLSQLSYDPISLLRSFALLFVMSMRVLSHVLAYAPSLAYQYASIKTKSLVNNHRNALKPINLA